MQFHNHPRLCAPRPHTASDRSYGSYGRSSSRDFYAIYEIADDLSPGHHYDRRGSYCDRLASHDDCYGRSASHDDR